MRSLSIVFILVIVLGGCVVTPNRVDAPNPFTAQDVIDKFNEAGLGVYDVEIEERDPDSPRPNSYRENLSFTIPEVAPKGGQVLVCDTKKDCDALYAFFDMWKGLAGPYYYQSTSGVVVVQLNSGLMPDTAKKFEEIVNSLP